MNKKQFDIIESLLLFGIIIFINIILSQYFFRIDLTEDKHFSIDNTSKELLKSINDKVYVEVYLDGKLTPDYERLKKSVKEKLDEFNLYSDGKVVYRFTNPNAIENAQLKEQYAAQLVQKGIEYRYEKIEVEGNVTEQLIFPSALVSTSKEETPVAFLKGNKSAPIADLLNQSVEVVEYQLMSAIRKLQHDVSGNVAFVEGHEELEATKVADISAALSDNYDVHRIALNDSTVNLQQHDLLIFARPQKVLTDAEQFKIDQYVVNGGKILLLVDAVNINEDSLLNGYTYALPYEQPFQDLLFKWGVRCNTDIIKDINCGLIQVATGNQGQLQTINWPFYPIVYNYGKHVIVKKLDAIFSKYPSTLDTVKANGIVKTPLLFTSRNTQVLATPMRIEFDEVRKQESPERFNQGVLPIGYLLEGKFESLYKNRPSPIASTPVAKINKESKIIVISDADIIRNDIDPRTGRPLALGFDKLSRYQFSNKDFVVNAVDYLMEQKLIALKNKEIKLRPLDKIKAKSEKAKWQVINLLLPVLLLILFGVIRYYLRKLKYEKF